MFRTSGLGKRIFSLDIIRGVAILLVLFYHNPVYPEFRHFIYWPITYFNKVGWMGVDLFFVLSGYLVGGLLIREIKKTDTLNIKRFILRRGFKIWPVYYFSVIAFLVVRPFVEKDLGPSYWDRFSILFADHLPNLFHVQNYFESTHRMGWLWSLGVEEHFYLLAPFFLLYFLGHKNNRSSAKKLKNTLIAFVAIFLSCLVLRSVTEVFLINSNSAFTFIFPSHLRIDSLAAGVFLAFFENYYPKLYSKTKSCRWVFGAAGVLLVSLPYVFPEKHQLFLYPWGLTLLWVGFSSIVLAISHNKTKMSELDPKTRSGLNKFLIPVGIFIAAIGVRSYSIYVWHGFWAKPISNKLCQILGLSGSDPHFGILNELIYLVTPIVLGTISFALIEEPFLRVREKFTAK